MCLGLFLSVNPGVIASGQVMDHAGIQKDKNIDYLKIVQAYADILIDKGRDVYGKEHSPLFAVMLDRENCKLFEQEHRKNIWDLRFKDADDLRLRNRDRIFTGANPMHDENLYQVLYALTEITGNQRYKEEADKAIKWFFEHCQSPVTGLMAWGEHMGWDFYTEGIVTWGKSMHHGGKLKESVTHEFARPWILWERSFELAPEPCTKFAMGLWEHQVADHNTGNFSRHANYEKHETFEDSEFPRHGGFYISAWAQAYKRTKDPVYIEAIDKIVTCFDSRRSPQSGAIPAFTADKPGKNILWALSNLSLAIDLWDASDKVPDRLSEKMRQCAAKTDNVFLKLNHDLKPDGKGFLISMQLDTLEPSKNGAYSGYWGLAGPANLCLTRYKQAKKGEYKNLALAAAEIYLENKNEPKNHTALHPSSLGRIIYLLAGLYELSGEERYLRRAEYYADRAVKLFLDDSSPLPKATSKHNHYEAVTGSDTLMMALLKLWTAKNRTGKNLQLIYSDR